MPTADKQINCLGTGLIYSNPMPHVHSRQAYFPSVVQLDNGEMLASIVLGEAFEASDLQTYIARSMDNGENWQLEQPVQASVPGRVTSNCARITALGNGELAMFMIRHDRTDHPDAGLTNPETLGFVPIELLLLRSYDNGRTWTEPSPITPSLAGPAFEICCPIIPIRDGRWLLPTQTWPGWNGDCPNGVRMIALVSHDGGATWPEHMEIMNEPGQQVYFWETKIVEFKNGDLLTTAWVYDDVNSKDRPNHFSLSKNGGASWTPLASCELIGQTLTPILLEDDSILSVYRRTDRPGLWANLSHLEDGLWVNDSSLPLWGHEAEGLVASTENMSHNFNVLKFGAPSICKLSDGTLFVAFWGYENGQSVIRWFKLKVS